MFSDNMPKDWKPSSVPSIGSLKWKRDVIENSVGRTHKTNICFDAGDIGVFCCQCTPGGWNYFWIDKENYKVLPKIDWKEYMEQAIKRGRE